MNHDPRRSEAGQTMAEYAVVLGSVCVAVVLALTLFGNAIQAGIEHATSLIPH